MKGMPDKTDGRYAFLKNNEQVVAYYSLLLFQGAKSTDCTNTVRMKAFPAKVI